MSKNQRRTAEILLDIKAVTLSPNKPYIFVSGIHSPIYTDNRLLMGYPRQRREITECMAEAMAENALNPEIIAGTATAGIAPAAWIADRLELPMIFVRKQAKDHGTGKLVEGIIEKEKNIVLIEDVISTGKSSLSAVDAIRNEGGTILNTVAFFEYGFGDTKKRFEEKKISLYTLTTLDTLVAVSLERGIIKKEDEEMIFAWRSNPWTWTEKMKSLQRETKTVEY